MNPTTAIMTPRSESWTQPADAPNVVTLTTDPRRPPVTFAASIRDPAPFCATLGAFLETVQADQVAPIVTVAADAWIIEGMAADQSAYARLSVPFELLDLDTQFKPGTISVRVASRLVGSARSIQMDAGNETWPDPGWPRGWLRGFAGIQAALSLPTRRVAIDRGGLFGLLTALGPSRTTRASRSIVVDWQPGRVASATVRSGGRPVPLHTQTVGDGLGGSVRVAVGHGLRALAGLLPWVDSVELGLLGPGLPSAWSVQLGGIRLLVALPTWTPDGRWGSFSLDPIIPPEESSQFLANQVAASFRDHPAQTQAEVVGRVRSNVPEVAAILSRFASLGQILAEPAPGLRRWRSAFGDVAAVIDDPEPAETTAARAILATTSIQVSRDEWLPAGRGRRVEGLILDRPVTVTLDPNGWLRRGRCTCSHGQVGGLVAHGPCRHLLALQAQAQARPDSPPRPADLTTWLRRFPLAMDAT